MALSSTPHNCNPPTGNYYSQCDQAGCGVNTYRTNNNAYGPSGTLINTNSPFMINATFKETNGQFSSVSFVLSQNGNIFNLPSPCSQSYLNSLTTALTKGMVLTMSYWGGTGQELSWLDVPPCDVSQNCDTGGSFTISNIMIS